ncbi:MULTISPECIES: sulfite exporter TauE/SafE family protein [Modicisalibacter]|uniref:sulfite exporter TauE/SafE family protein n=1 Tax=Modicisalibacter TaxID=574347 RepID=UPI00100B1CAD|nr:MULTISPECIES: sulfite exporter TauE/SafE family protein [Halomonadaceae]MBZ9557502.1 sulfite exporter TauE/SafE family protein [Modicisalibacter sp. R2A 31.J]MBZ9573833.1 sulfite exporter TauE/SafE family protein [Modicisalibacter sp. MOD 31.J]
MTFETAAVIAFAYLMAAFVKGATGLGFSTTALPILALSLGLKSAMPLVLLPSVVSNTLVMVQVGHFRETLRRFWPMFLATVPGLLVGLAVLGRVNGLMAGAILGVVLVGYGLWTLLRPGRPISNRTARWLAPLSGFLTGLFNGMTGSQVMPILPFMLALRLDPGRLVQAINISFSLSSLVMAMGLSRLGLMSLETLWISLAGLIPVYLGVRLGGILRRHLDGETFRRLVLIMLIVLGVTLIGKSLTL